MYVLSVHQRTYMYNQTGVWVSSRDCKQAIYVATFRSRRHQYHGYGGIGTFMTTMTRKITTSSLSSRRHIPYIPTFARGVNDRTDPRGTLLLNFPFAGIHRTRRIMEKIAGTTHTVEVTAGILPQKPMMDLDELSLRKSLGN